MVRRAALAAYALVAGAPGCIHPDYHCMSDLDCDVGEACSFVKLQAVRLVQPTRDFRQRIAIA